jgi:hypothetical protein
MGLTRPRLGQMQTTTSAFDDPIVVLNNGATGTNTKDIGIVFERGDDQNRVLLWDESADEFVLANSTEQGSTSGNVTIASYANLHVNNIITSGSVNTLTINDAYTLPITDGNAGYVLTTDGSGNVSWSAASSGGHTIQNAGSNLTTRSNLNFDGTYLVATDDLGNDQTDITISSSVATTSGTQTLDNKTIDGGSY